MFPLAGCINEFIPKDIREESGLLIIDGAITDGESVFTLSRSVGISEKLSEEVMIDHAVVAVESNDGARIPATFGGEGRYLAQTGSLDTNLQYRLSVEVDGETYQSEYLSPIITAEVDSIFPMKKEEGEPVYICLSSHAPENSSKYYRWKYHETWEVKAELYANARWNDGPGEEEVIFHSRYTSENTYYCWGRDSSKSLILGNTEKLNRNIVSQQKIIQIPCDNDKLSILYYIEVEQMQIREAAYRYFSDIQERAERVGDLFSPVLSAGLRGNIRCVNDPEQMVVGYIDVSTTTRKERYVWEKEGLYEFPGLRCRMIYEWGGKGEAIFSYEHSRAPYQCVDCREKEHASKLKPDGWPTDHL
ncbi:MAG: DUF4249 domain-containing protein [Tannerellaceae bacterium]|nr:DUF4249 domain-containing protein [Tannerellaceae bacterium]